MRARRRIAAFVSATAVAAFGTVVAAPAASAASPTEVFFSEYIEGSSNNKALEIYNGTGGAVDLAASDYNVQMFFNGSATAGLTINLTGAVADGDVHVVAQSSASATILAQADQTNGAGWFNGDDAVVLRKGTTVLDVIGQIGFDPGSQWGSDPTSTADNTLRRLETVCAGDPDGSNAFDPSVEWIGYATDTFDGLGVHVATCAAGPADPVINEFSASTTGTDVEYVEIFGDPSTDHSAYTLLEIEGDSGTAVGTVDEVIPLGTTEANGLYLVNLAANALENGTISLLLVEGFAGALGDDLDTDNDGVLDITPWDAIVDSVAVNDGGAGDITYGSPTLGVAYDGLPFAPGGASRIPDGVDTDAATDWVRNDFDLAGIPGFTGTPAVGEAYNTPGAPNVAYVLPVGDDAPAVTSTTPTNGATDVAVDANISITFSEPVNVADPWFTFSCTTSGAVTATVSGELASWTLDPTTDLAFGEDCTVTVLAASITDQDTEDLPDNMLANYEFSFSTAAVDQCTLPYTPIYDIQGSGATAAITGTVSTEGVVVGDFEGSASASGFYLQDLSGDGNPETSDGIFVYTGNTDVVSVGDVVRVTGFARERFNQTTINGSNSNSAAVPAANIEHCDVGTVAPTQVTLPFESSTYPERFEGMLVELPQSLTIAEYFNFDRFGEIVLALPLEGESRAFTPTSIEEPGADAIARALANSLRRITLDDAQSAQNPPVLRHPNGDPFTLDNRFRGGDLVANTVGVLGYDFNLYRIIPTGPADYTSVNPRSEEPDDVGGTLQVGSFNTLNYFLTLDTGAWVCGASTDMECRGADDEGEFSRQRVKLLQAIIGLDADVLALNELENTPGVEPLADIVAGLNELAGTDAYSYIDAGVIGTDAIRVGMIYQTASIAPVGDHAILDSSVDPRFIDTLNRPVLAQTFEEIATGARFTMTANHLKSKGSACAADPDTGDGQGNCNLTREAAAQALVDWLAADPTVSGDPDFLIAGDLNSYAMEDPIDAIKAGPDDMLGTADDWTNLIERYEGTYAYSYVFDGQAGYLDHALSSATLTGQVTGATTWHINADEPDVLDYDTTFKPPAQDLLYELNAYRTSDHDPVLVGLELVNPAPVIETFTVTPLPVMVGNTVTASATFSDADLLDTHTATIDWGDGTVPTDGVVVEADGSGTVSGTHAYMDAGVYTVTITVTDGFGEDTSTAEVIVFDPDAGFVTGGGWYQSPRGSFADDLDWAGKATFGLSAKYEPGMTAPTGSFDLNLVGAPFMVSASVVDWLVVSGDTARFAGPAMVNGMDGYSYDVTVMDGGKKGDTISVRIMDADGMAVYDSDGAQPVKGQLTLQQTS